MVMESLLAGSLGLDLDLDLNKGVHLARRAERGRKDLYSRPRERFLDSSKL